MPCFADYPYLNDDAFLTDPHHFQFYFFSGVISATHTGTLYAPAIETDYGLMPNIELHLITPITTAWQDNYPNGIGLGDFEFGIKYLFVQETAYVPAIAFAPLFELPTGDSDRNLGNGKLWYKVPLWLQKQIGPWTIDLGGGYGFNSAPGMVNFPYGGLAVQRQVTDKLLLGSELYLQGRVANNVLPPQQDSGAFSLLHLGLNYYFTPQFGSFISVGHSLTGVMQWVSYVGVTLGV